VTDEQKRRNALLHCCLLPVACLSRVLGLGATTFILNNPAEKRLVFVQAEENGSVFGCH